MTECEFTCSTDACRLAMRGSFPNPPCSRGEPIRVSNASGSPWSSSRNVLIFRFQHFKCGNTESSAPVASKVGGWSDAGFRQRFKGSRFKSDPLHGTTRPVQRRLSSGQRPDPAHRSPNSPRPVSGRPDDMACDLSPEAATKTTVKRGRRHGKNGQGAASSAAGHPPKSV